MWVLGIARIDATFAQRFLFSDDAESAGSAGSSDHICGCHLRLPSFFLYLVWLSLRGNPAEDGGTSYASGFLPSSSSLDSTAGAPAPPAVLPYRVIDVGRLSLPNPHVA